MSIEAKRNLLRISKEKQANLNNIEKFFTNQNSISQMNIITDAQQSKVDRIKTEIKSQNIGKKLHPDYIGKYKGSSFIAAGCGASINLYRDFSNHFVIGVNDIERILIPDFLVVVNDYRTFVRGRWEYIKDAICPVIFSHLDNPGPITRASNLVKIDLGGRNSLNLDDLTKVDYTMNSPYMAAIIAYQLGARKIAIVGVDFTQDHFFSKTGDHKLIKHLAAIDNEYLILGKELQKRGIIIANISPISQLESWPKMSLEEFEKL